MNSAVFPSVTSQHQGHHFQLRESMSWWHFAPRKSFGAPLRGGSSRELSGEDFAKHIGVTPATVSRWENDKLPIGPQADRLLRLMAVHEPVRCEYGLDELADIADDVVEEPVFVARGRRGWAMRHAPAA